MKQPKNYFPQRIRTFLLRASISTILIQNLFFRPSGPKQSVSVFNDTRPSSHFRDPETSSTSSDVHVAMGSGAEHWVGLRAAVVSMVNNTKTPENLHVHIFLLDSNRTGVMRLSGAHLHFHSFSDADVQPYTNNHFSRTSGGDLKSPYNFVRFLLHERLLNVSSCLWLDSDIIVAGDVVAFVSQIAINMALAAFPRSLVQPTNDAYRKLREAGIYVADPAPGFNAGVLLFNLDAWRTQNADVVIRRICSLNEQMNLWPLFGSQPPLLMLYGGDRFQHLNSSLFVGGLGHAAVSDVRIKQGLFLHWSGSGKPWQPNGKHKKWWALYDAGSDDREVVKLQDQLAELHGPHLTG